MMRLLNGKNNYFIKFKNILLYLQFVYFLFIYIALLVTRPQYKPNIKTKPTIEIPTTKKYFLEGEVEISSYISPRFSITLTWKKIKNYIKI